MPFSKWKEIYYGLNKTFFVGGLHNKILVSIFRYKDETLEVWTAIGTTISMMKNEKLFKKFTINMRAYHVVLCSYFQMYTLHNGKHRPCCDTGLEFQGYVIEKINWTRTYMWLDSHCGIM